MGNALREIKEPAKMDQVELVPEKKVSKKMQKDESVRLREFGVLMAAVLSGVAAVLLWRGRGASFYMLILATLFLMPAYLNPTLLKPIEKGWLLFGEKMSVVMTTVMLVLTYFLMITPIGLLLRLTGKDLLDIKLDPGAKSYWKEIEKDGPTTRPYLPY